MENMFNLNAKRAPNHTCCWHVLLFYIYLILIEDNSFTLIIEIVFGYCL